MRAKFYGYYWYRSLHFAKSLATCCLFCQQTITIVGDGRRLSRQGRQLQSATKFFFHHLILRLLAFGGFMLISVQFHFKIQNNCICIIANTHDNYKDLIFFDERANTSDILMLLKVLLSLSCF